MTTIQWEQVARGGVRAVSGNSQSASAQNNKTDSNRSFKSGVYLPKNIVGSY